MHVPHDSVLLIDKPLGWSSFDVIRYLKKQYRLTTPPESYNKKYKIGHAGTLDPLATGLLIVCTGKETKNILLYQGQTKEYHATITFGGTTPSYDAEFAPENLVSADFVTPEIITNSLQHFIGDIEQTPPIYSAIKINGKRAYQIARTKTDDTRLHAQDLESTKPRSRNVHVYSFVLDSLKPRYSLYKGHTLVSYTFIIRCSKGTYIRSLAHDLGQQLKTGAYLSSLRRTKIGDFSVDNAFSIENNGFTPSVQPAVIL